MFEKKSTFISNKLTFKMNHNSFLYIYMCNPIISSFYDFYKKNPTNVKLARFNKNDRTSKFFFCNWPLA